MPRTASVHARVRPGGLPRLRSRYAQMVEGARPYDWWPCDDPDGTTALRNVVNPSNTLGSHSNVSTDRGSSLLQHDPLGGSRGVGRMKCAGNWTATTKGTIEAIWQPSNYQAGAIGAWGSNGAMIFIGGGSNGNFSIYMNTTFVLCPVGTYVPFKNYHLALTWNGTVEIGYLNGVPVISQAVGSPSSPGRVFEVGSYNNSSGGAGLSRWQHIAVYDRDLSAGELLAHAAGAQLR